MHNPHLLALLSKIPKKSVVTVEHAASVATLDPDVRAVLDDFAENPRSARHPPESQSPQPLTLTGGYCLLRDPSDCCRGIPCSTLSGLSRQPQGNEHDHH